MLKLQLVICNLLVLNFLITSDFLLLFWIWVYTNLLNHFMKLTTIFLDVGLSFLRLYEYIPVLL